MPVAMKEQIGSSWSPEHPTEDQRPGALGEPRAGLEPFKWGLQCRPQPDVRPSSLKGKELQSSLDQNGEEMRTREQSWCKGLTERQPAHLL